MRDLNNHWGPTMDAVRQSGEPTLVVRRRGIPRHPAYAMSYVAWQNRIAQMPDENRENVETCEVPARTFQLKPARNLRPATHEGKHVIVTIDREPEFVFVPNNGSVLPIR